MKLFSFFKKIDSEALKDKLIRKNAAKNSILFVIGTLISALAFNLFLVPHGFVTGGLNGLSIIIRNFFPDVTNTIQSVTRKTGYFLCIDQIYFSSF